jgi:hypothetical protein
MKISASLLKKEELPLKVTYPFLKLFIRKVSFVHHVFIYDSHFSSVSKLNDISVLDLNRILNMEGGHEARTYIRIILQIQSIQKLRFFN